MLFIESDKNLLPLKTDITTDIRGVFVIFKLNLSLKLKLRQNFFIFDISHTFLLA